ncbi:MAG: hypothetical protein IJ783_10055 [Kiritimatiellae bacterium]|nr:hypothetical protein [Kiritimatiellia bacterium]
MTRFSDNSGTVLMEYAVVTCFVAVVMLVFMQKAEFASDGTPISGFFNFREGYVGLGAEWASHVRLLHRAVAIPIP